MEMQQTDCYATGTVMLLWKRNRVHKSCHQGNPKYVTINIALFGIQDKGSIVDLQNCVQLYLASAFLILFYLPDSNTVKIFTFCSCFGLLPNNRSNNVTI
jgi:hypothetical protein